MSIYGKNISIWFSSHIWQGHLARAAAVAESSAAPRVLSASPSSLGPTLPCVAPAVCRSLPSVSLSARQLPAGWEMSHEVHKSLLKSHVHNQQTTGQ